MLLVIALCIPLGGCWNYRGLDTLAIVLGMAIDKNANGNFVVSYEFVDFSSASQQAGSPKPGVFQSEGKTIFDAVRNAKKKLADKLYFTHIQILIISEQIAREDGIRSVLDWFLRDSEPRENINILVSQEKTAGELLSDKGIDSSFVSEAISNILNENKSTISFTKQVILCHAANALDSEGVSLVIPAFHSVKNQSEKTFELNGVAVFKEDKMLGYLSSDDTRAFLFADNEVGGGLITVNTEKLGEVTLEISASKTKREYTYDGTKIKMKIHVKTSVFLGERQTYDGIIKSEDIEDVQTTAEQNISQQVKTIIQKIRSEYNSDIFGFGSIIYKKDPKLWSKLKKNGDQYFQDMEFEVKTDVTIVNTATIM